MDWNSIFSRRNPEPGATDYELDRVASTLFTALSDAEVSEAEVQASRNPFPISHPLHASFRPLDPARWRLPNATLPPSYLDFLRFSNGGDFGNGDRWLQFFSALDSKSGLRAMLLAYEFPEYMPMALPFAFNGGGAFYIFDLRGPAIDQEYPIVASHSGSLGWDSEDHWVVAATFPEACAGTTSIEQPMGPSPRMQEFLAEQVRQSRILEALHGADAAFRERRFQDVVSLLGPLEAGLKKTDLWKLNYAKKQVVGGDRGSGA